MWTLSPSRRWERQGRVSHRPPGRGASGRGHPSARVRLRLRRRGLIPPRGPSPSTRPEPRSDRRAQPRGRRCERHPTHRVAVDLHLARVDADPDLDAELAYRLRDRPGAADCARRTVECREEAVAGGVDLAPPVPGKLRSCLRVMCGRADPARRDPQARRPLHGADDVGEHDRGQVSGPSPRAGGGRSRRCSPRPSSPRASRRPSM